MAHQPPPTPSKCREGRERSHSPRKTSSKARRLLVEFSQPSSSTHPGPSGAEDYEDVAAEGSHNVKRNIDHMLALLRDAEAKAKPPSLLSELKNLLKEVCQYMTIDEVAQHCDHKGLDLMQRAVVSNCVEFVEFMLMKGYHMKLTRRPCDNPLHLACKMGHAKIVCLLMRYGADFKHLSSICYPSVHHHRRLSLHPSVGPNSFSFIPSNPFCAYSSKCTPLYAALIHDNLEIVRIIMNSKSCPAIDMKALQFACKHGAQHCLAFLVPFAPQEVCKRFPDGTSFLSYAFSKSYTCGKILLENSDIEWPRDVLEDCTGKQDSLLHIVYRNCTTDDIASLTHTVFHRGISRDIINKQDRNGNTPLHILMKQVGRRVGSSWNLDVMSELQQNTTLSQDSKDEQVFSTACLLINEGADLFIRNKIDESILHHLLQDTFYRRLYGMNASYYHGVLPEINRMLEYLLGRGAEVDCHSSLVSTPLIWLTHILCSMESSEIETTWPEILYTFRMLLRHGASPNMDDEKGISIVSLLLTAVSRWMHQCIQRNEMDAACCILRHMNELIELLFLFCLEPVPDVLDLCAKQVAILCNVGVTERLFLHGVRGLLVPFFLNGINPNTMRIIRDHVDQAVDIPCPLSGQFYLARAFIIHHQDEGMLSFLSLFDQTLEQMNANQLSQTLCSILVSNFKDDQEDGGGEMAKSVQLLSAWSRKPRSLKMLSKAQNVAQKSHFRKQASKGDEACAATRHPNKATVLLTTKDVASCASAVDGGGCLLCAIAVLGLS
ncbi:hypothetical protein CAPTEDRAFT_188745 [Capitella teleta]|uniref:Uncharacterized protein n=1 Tax=Capitella teleta TaxID=283909 RepID=R7T6N2_CAPTE|nr:hypothetical protein CAPTEDRAFT_188745 [Capitella teleta]|eukprot:ELT89028.1 hypothetical protein CAPTEDRAFT_188745 [Capitella teleta]